ncbi:MAG: cytochrome b/b6 domain-containing protein [Pirellulales bacterium]|nr:cytochrome b/b6 domain-containing protein [Pirellulales bacterium]
MEPTASPKRWSLPLRCVHWLEALVLLGLLGTVLLRKTFLNWRTNGEVIREKLAQRNVEIASDVAAGIARAIRAPMWQWHYYLGFALAVLVLWRIYLLVRGEREILTTSLLGRGGNVTLKKRATRTVHVIYYLAVLGIVATGLALYFNGRLGLPGSVLRVCMEIHETLTWFFVIFVPLHVAGAFLAECTSEPGIVSAMINGKRPD